ncbi:hypothetical protein [Pseudomonas koreensis]|uniref:Uncharacterized protein n=1 Tax=Pseudomonas koreensis TaxID=198620 RepID=A0AA94JGH9_9PSED|nr:hypothetical protein [Pseudomonas koreensis]RVD75435.1 hypothetical protein A9HBioS_4555 [Pseudomonas koreensis]
MERIDAPVKLNVNLTTEDITKNLEIIEVCHRNTHVQDSHYILIETQLKSTTWSLQGTPTASSKITVRATYLYGSQGLFKAGQLISEMGGELNDSRKMVKLTNGSVMVDGCMQGLHIGTYIFHKIVSWAKQFAPSYTVAPITVISGDAGKGNKERRNKLYMNSGIRFIWEGEEGREGRSDPALTISELTPYANWPNINKDYGMKALDKTWRELSILKERVRGLKKSQRYYRKEYETIRSRLRAIASFLNMPMYAICILLGLGIGKAFGWYQGF